jgi:hypothetical protein
MKKQLTNSLSPASARATRVAHPAKLRIFDKRFFVLLASLLLPLAPGLLRADPISTPVPVTPALDTPPPYRNGPFLHPGGLHTLADLERIKTRVAERRTPWIEAWEQLLKDPRAQAGYRTAHRSNLGTSRQRASLDAHAAYLNALRGLIADDSAHIDAAIRILNDWSAAVNQRASGRDIPGLLGIPAAEFAIAGELLRASPRWRPEDIARFQRMLVTYVYPTVRDFLIRHNDAHITHYWTNWDACNIGALIAIGVFCDRPDIYDQGVAYYLRGEGNGSIMNAVYKIHPGGLGQWQESGRDQPHAQLGVGLLAQAAQIAWNQGLDLFGVADNRLLAGAEYVARSNLNHPVPYAFYTNSQPANNHWLSINGINRLDERPTWELLYNHYAVLRGLPAPNTAAMAALLRPERGSKDHLGHGTLAFTLDAASSPWPPLPVPDTPAGLSALAGVSRVELAWQSPPGDTASGYEIHRAPAPDGPWETLARWTDNASTRHLDTRVENGITYHYRVAALNQVGASPFTAPVTATPGAAGPLPPGWRLDAIGLPSAAPGGSATYSPLSGHTLLLSGPGARIGGPSDSLTFASRKISGDFTLTARLAGVRWSRGGNRVGLMLRDTLSPGTRAAFLTLGDVGARQTRFGVRPAANAAPRHQNGNDYTWLPVWYRLRRQGDTITASHSPDGETWFDIGSARVPLAQEVHAGFALAASSTDTPVAATFTHVTLTPRADAY